jgi:hypothetical protein
VLAERGRGRLQARLPARRRRDREEPHGAPLARAASDAAATSPSARPRRRPRSRPGEARSSLHPPSSSSGYSARPAALTASDAMRVRSTSWRAAFSAALRCPKVAAKPRASAREQEKAPEGLSHARYVEATMGFEPMNRGFADLRLRPLGYVAPRPDRIRPGGNWLALEDSNLGSRIQSPASYH